jgi:hypothetical protein
MAADCDSPQIIQVRYRGSLQGIVERSDWCLGHDLLASEARTFDDDVQIIVSGLLKQARNTRLRVSSEREGRFATCKALTDGVDPVAERQYEAEVDFRAV